MFRLILVEFLFRLTFGIAVAMALTPSRWVTSGFFRVHLWVLMGFQTLAALALRSVASSLPGKSQLAAVNVWQFALAVTAAVASYLGAVVWMYERRLSGKIVILLVAACALAGSLLPPIPAGSHPLALHIADRISGGLLLGLVTAAMLLGHWYLNTPTMKLQPLQRLIALLGIAVVFRAAVCLVGLWLAISHPLASQSMPAQTWIMFLLLRWLTGLAGAALLAWLTWQTLKIPNTQSATGILYAAVILAYIGELTSQLLTAQVGYPV